MVSLIRVCVYIATVAVARGGGGGGDGACTIPI